jgi:hypothetical protein
VESESVLHIARCFLGRVGTGAGWCRRLGRDAQPTWGGAATFGGIHFYTQWFERLRATPKMVIAAGVIAVAIAFALWRYNQRQSAAVMV